MYSVRKININQVDLYLYEKCVLESDNASSFLSLSWLKSISFSSYGYRLKFLEFSEKNKVCGYMPYFEKYLGLLKVCNIWGCYGGYVSLNGHDFDDTRLSGIVSQFVYNNNGLHDFLFSKKQNLSTWIKRIDNSYNTIFNSLHKKTKNQIRKAQKSNLTYVKVDSLEMATECYGLYQQLIKKHGINRPLHIDTFLELSKCNDIDFIACRYNGAFVAYSVFLYSNTECFYWLNASNSEFSDLNATNGILDYVLKKTCENEGILTLNFGAVPLGNTGLHHFKSRWGAEEKLYFRVTGLMK